MLAIEKAEQMKQLSGGTRASRAQVWWPGGFALVGSAGSGLMLDFRWRLGLGVMSALGLRLDLSVLD